MTGLSILAQDKYLPSCFVRLIVGQTDILLTERKSIQTYLS